jgi:ribulose-bisphosphate carboxylase small chain
VQACRAAKPNTYIRVNGYDRRYTKQTVALSFLVQRPGAEPGFRLERQESSDRVVRYTLHSYATDKPAGERYGNGE